MADATCKLPSALVKVRFQSEFKLSVTLALQPEAVMVAEGVPLTAEPAMVTAAKVELVEFPPSENRL